MILFLVCSFQIQMDQEQEIKIEERRQKQGDVIKYASYVLMIYIVVPLLTLLFLNDINDEVPQGLNICLILKIIFSAIVSLGCCMPQFCLFESIRECFDTFLWGNIIFYIIIIAIYLINLSLTGVIWVVILTHHSKFDSYYIRLWLVITILEFILACFFTYLRYQGIKLSAELHDVVNNARINELYQASEV
jgi:hypothetical protein